MVERRTVNPLVGGSNPSRGANKINNLHVFSENLLRYSRVGNSTPRLPIRIPSPGRVRFSPRHRKIATRRSLILLHPIFPAKGAGGIFGGIAVSRGAVTPTPISPPSFAKLRTYEGDRDVSDRHRIHTLDPQRASANGWFRVSNQLRQEGKFILSYNRPELRLFAERIQLPVNLQQPQQGVTQLFSFGEPLQRSSHIAPLRIDASIRICGAVTV